MALSSGCTVITDAKTPTPNLLPPEQKRAAQLRFQFESQIAKLPDGRVCSAQGGLRDVCVDHLVPTLRDSLRRSLSQYFSGAGPRFTAKFTLVGFAHAMTSARTGNGGGGGGGTVGFTMQWQFTLRDSAGRAVVRIAQMTKSPQDAANTFGVGDSGKSLMEAVIENVAKLTEKATAATPPKAGLDPRPATPPAR